MKKSYKVTWKNGKVVSTSVNGVRYDDPEQIANEGDRAAVARLIARAVDADSGWAIDGKKFDEEFRMMGGKSSRLPNIIVAIFLAVALLMLGIAAVSAIDTSRSLAREQSAAGRVVDMVVRLDNSGQVFYYPVVEFYLPDETLQTAQVAAQISAPAYDTGQQVTVLYDPERPSSARIASTGGGILLWIVPIITGFIGIAFLGATFFARWVLKSEPRTLNSTS